MYHMSETVPWHSPPLRIQQSDLLSDSTGNQPNAGREQQEELQGLTSDSTLTMVLAKPATVPTA